MTDSGWVKLWRKSLDSGLMQNPELWLFWSWCLLKATHKPCRQVVGWQTVDLQPGQFVFGRKKAAAELPLSEQTIRTCLKKLEKLENLTIKPTNKFSIITIVNWGSYQDINQQDHQQDNQQLTSSQPAANHKQECKEHKNVKKNTPPKSPQGDKVEYPEWLDQKIWQEFKAHRRRLNKPMTPHAEKLNINKIEKLMEQGHQPEDLINLAIEKGWQGIYPPKNGTGPQAQNSTLSPKQQHNARVLQKVKEDLYGDKGV